MRVERSVVLAAPPEDVWGAIAEPDRLASWLGGRVELEARSGGRVMLSDEDGERWGTVESFEPGRLLVLRLWKQSSGLSGLSGTRLEFSLADEEEGTRLTVVESPIGPGGGWTTGRRQVTVSRG